MRAHKWLTRPMVLAVSSCFGMPAWANPTGPQVIQGAAAFQGLGSNNLKVTNSPSAVIHWQGFSIGSGQVTNFVQQSAASAVLNRVVGADISQIHGQLLSNGRVFLINPAGILIGASGVIDTAGFVGSTLNMLDSDFLAGKLRFQGDASSGSIVNQGWIKTVQGGNVVLVAPHIENSGLIHTPGGELILAAGQKMTIASLDPNGVQFEIQAPTDSVLNVGKLIADGGAVGVFAGTLKHSGDIRAGALVRDEAGRIVLKAQSELTLAAGSTTTANGKSGGDIVIQSTSGQTRVSGEVAATGSAGKGGDIQVLGDRVSIVDSGMIDASGAAGGGQIRIGGDYQGNNAAVQNASRTFVGSDALLRADATEAGDGGRVIVWADKSTQFYGGLSARGGTQGGNGGFAEVSGKERLVFGGTADLGAPKGRHGAILFDPLDLFIENVGGNLTSLVNEPTDIPDNAITISPAALAAISGDVALFAGRYMRFTDPVNLTRAGQGLTATVATATSSTPSGTPSNRMDVAANITTNGGFVTLSAPSITGVGFPGPLISTNGGAVTITSPGFVFGLNGTLSRINVDASSLSGPGGAVNVSSTGSSLQVGTLAGGSVNASGPGSVTTGAITATGPVVLTSLLPTESGGFTGSSITAGAISTGGGTLTVDAFSSATLSNVQTANGAVNATARNGNFTTQGGTITSGTGAVNISGAGVFTGAISTTNGTAGSVVLNGTSGRVTVAGISSAGGVSITGTGGAQPAINSGTIDTPAVVTLTGRENSINATIDNASSVIATNNSTANNNSRNANITIASNTALNATSIAATATGCQNLNACTGAQVTLTAAGNINVGSVSASASRAPTSLARTESVSLTSTAGSLLPMPGVTSQITASDVILSAAGSIGRPPGDAVPGPLNVDARRSLTFTAGNSFVINLNGAAGLNQLNANIIPNKPTSGSVNGGGITLTTSIESGSVELQELTIGSGFNAAVVDNQSPAIALNINGGRLTIGSGAILSVPSPAAVSLPLTFTSTDNLNVSSFTRGAGPTGALTTFESSAGTATIGTIEGNHDNVVIKGASGVLLTRVNTSGNVDVTSTGGSISLAHNPSNDPTISADGAVTLTVGMSAGRVVGAATDNAFFEVVAGGDLSVTGNTIGTPGGSFLRPLDMQAPKITLTSTAPGGHIGFPSDTPAFNNAIVAQTSDLTIVAAQGTSADGASFNVSTGSSSLQKLSVTANGTGVGAPSTNSAVKTSSGAYDFNGSAGILILPAQTAAAGDFTAPDALFQVSTNTGDMQLNGNINVGNAALTLAAGSADFASGSIDGATRTLDARNVTLSAKGDIAVGNIGAALVPGFVLVNASSAATLGSVVASTSLGITAGGAVTTGALTVPTITIGGSSTESSGALSVTGAITNLKSLTARSGSANITGAITGDGSDGGTVDIKTNSSPGALTIGGNITNLGNGSTVNLDSSGRLTVGPGGAAIIDANTITLTNNAGSTAPAFTFDRLNAGLTGAVSVFSDSGIDQTAAGTGITAKTVILGGPPVGGFPTETKAIGRNGGASALLLTGTTDLTVSSNSNVRLDGQNTSTLEKLDVTKGNTSSVFELGGFTGQTFTFTPGAAAFQVEALTDVANPPLEFTLTSTGGGIVVSGDGIVTQGGSVSLSSLGGTAGLGGISNIAPAGINTTGSPIGAGGHVTLKSSNGSITTGSITTPPTALKPAAVDPERAAAAIDVSTSCSPCNIVVSGDLSTGTLGGPIVLNVFGSGSITRTGGTISSQSPNSVMIKTVDGDIGAFAAPLVIDSPGVTLNASAVTPSATAGNVFATINNTTATPTTRLDLTADNSFDVTSPLKPFDVLSVTTRGTGTGTTLNLSAPGQSYAFARPSAGVFQVVTAAGTTAPPPSSATFRTSDGHLLVGEGANITSPTLTLEAMSETGDLLFRGTGSSLTLNNSVQSFTAGRDLEIAGNATISGVNQTLRARNGNVSLLGGSGDGQAVSVSATGNQQIFTDDFTDSVTGDIRLYAGSGTGSSVSVSFNGATNANVIGQLIEARRNVDIKGGGTNSTAAISGAGQQQLVRASRDVLLTGGSGTDATARIVNTGGAAQQVGESRRTSSFSDEPYQTDNVTLQGGGGLRSSAAITSDGPQRIFTRGGTVSVLGGNGPGADAFASIDTSSTSSQFVGLNTSFFFGYSTTALNVRGGTASGAYASITAPNLAPGSTQFITTAGPIALTAGAAANSYALIQSPQNQSVSAGGNLTLTAAGTAAAPLPNSGAVIEGRQQSVSAAALLLEGGAGTAASPSDARITNRAGNQSVSANSIEVRGGTVNSTTGIINSGTGTQSVSGFNGITLTGNAVGANADVLIKNTPATAQTVSATNGAISLDNKGSGLVGISSAAEQTLTSRSINVLTSAGATGNSVISAAGNQTARTSNTLSTPAPFSVRVAALGSGMASLDSEARQFLEVDYPAAQSTTLAVPGNIAIGAVNGGGVSRIRAADQSIFARTISLQGGAAAGSTANLTGTSTQSISSLGPMSVSGGTGTNASATIESPTQTIVASRDLNLTGGGAGNTGARLHSTAVQALHFDMLSMLGGVAGASALIDSSGPQTLIGNSGTLTGGSGSDALARITSTGTQSLFVTSLTLNAGTGSGGDAKIDSTGVQSFNGTDLTVAGSNAGGANALITSTSNQIINLAGALTVAGGAGTSSTGRITTTANQTIGFRSLTVQGGAGGGALASIDTAGAQTLIGGVGNVALTAGAGNAIVEGKSQNLSCGPACTVTLQSGAPGSAILRNLAGDQTISAGGISLTGDANSAAGTSALIENAAATLQSISATSGDTALRGRGAGTVAITSAGTQSIETRALDVMTQSGATPALNTSNATVSAASNQTIHTRGALQGAPNVGVRVVSRSTGVAKIQSGGNQVLDIGYPELVEGQLVIGSLFAVTPANPPQPAFAAVGDSLVLATNAAATANQTLRAGSIYIQGPSGSSRISKLSADATQNITTLVSGVTIIGGAGADSLATIDPTNQSITSFGPILMQGGTGPNADSIINATGPQFVRSQNGGIILVGGQGQGADALIITTSPFQTVFGPNGAAPLLVQGRGGIAGLQHGTDNGGATIAGNSLINELVREQNRLNETLEDAEIDQDERKLRRGTLICR